MGKKLDAALNRAQQAEKALRNLTDDLLEREQIEYRAEQQRIIDQISGGTIPVSILRDRITERELRRSGYSGVGVTLRITVERVDPISVAIQKALS